MRGLRYASLAVALGTHAQRTQTLLAARSARTFFISTPLRCVRVPGALTREKRHLHTTGCALHAEHPSAAAAAAQTASGIQFVFQNNAGDQVSISLQALAGQLTDGTDLALPKILVPPENDPDGEPVQPDWATVPTATITEDACHRTYTLNCRPATLRAFKEYVEWPREMRHKKALPKPLQNTLKSYVTPEEMEFVERVDKDGHLIDLVDMSLAVHHSALADLCAAYASVRIDEIAKAAPNIMEGAERIRQYLGLKNEWTPEEMKHLENEMKVIKELDPNAY